MSPSGSPSVTRVQDRQALETKPGSSPDVGSDAAATEALNTPVTPTYSASSPYNHVSSGSTNSGGEGSAPLMTGNLAILMISVLKQAGSTYQDAGGSRSVLDIRA
jgi:hypothetical protein